jgi:putative hydrolase of the HAD superfamily
MPTLPCSDIRGIVFDLDGTLYVCDDFAASIHDVATDYIASLKGIGRAEAGLMMTATRLRLSEESDTLPTLSSVCVLLGGDIRELHCFFEEKLRPEACLVRDERVINLLARLSEQFPLYIYTNNNRALATRIINYLGLDGMFKSIFAIDDYWIAKPDEEMLAKVLAEIGLKPAEALFVGDRYDVDLRVPEQQGCPVYLSQSLEQLLRLEELITRRPSSNNPATPAYPPVALP